jgi:glutamate synthase (NADPH/NADH) small chain
MPADSAKAKRLPRQPMPEQDPATRARNFEEVALGFTAELAIAEASRCLQCEQPKCVEGCPVGIDIPGFLALVRDGRFAEAAARVRERNSLPAICGRVCPQESQCEGLCVLGKKGKPVAVGRVERFVGDYALGAPAAGGAGVSPADSSTRSRDGCATVLSGPRIAVVGSGPAGLTVAGDLARLGYGVTIFEALHGAGGVLRYGIPNFRLPKTVLDAEIEYVRGLGVEVRPNAVIGRLFTLPALLEAGYAAAFIGTGAGTPHFMRIPGENLNGVYSANEFLTRANLMQAYRVGEVDTPLWVGERVAVVGGGNVAMDAARVALRMGAREVTIVYRRSGAEMPARAEEALHAQEEGIRFEYLTCPTRVLSNGDFWAARLECQRMDLGEPDESGRRRPVPRVGSEFTLAADTVIIAIGSAANPLIQRTTPGLAVNERGYIIADPDTGRTSLRGVYAGGDIVTGSATVIEAMGAGRRAAAAIHDELG